MRKAFGESGIQQGPIPGHGKISDGLKALVTPLLPHPCGLDQVHALVGLAALGWNLAVHEDFGAKEVTPPDYDEFPARDRQEVAALVGAFKAKKRLLHPSDRRLVMHVEVVADGRSFKIMAASTPLGDATPA